MTPFRIDSTALLRRCGVVSEATGTIVRARGVQAREAATRLQEAVAARELADS